LQGEGGVSDNGKYEMLWRAAIASGADGFFVDNVKELEALLEQTRP
jgi:glycerophosphoryl diester phosphodiesterase